jgi:DNA-binding CsgD family transcriptional regulator
MPEVDNAFLEAASEVRGALIAIPSPAALLDENGTIQWQNKASLALRGRRVGSDFAEFVAPEDKPAARSLLNSMLARGGSAELAVRALNAEGKYVALLGRWSVVPVRNGRKVVVVLNLGETSDRESPSPAAGPSALLTPRQLDVLRLLADGRSTPEIATTLALSETTVRNHIANLLSALDVHSRLQAVVVAREGGLLDG